MTILILVWLALVTSLVVHTVLKLRTLEIEAEKEEKLEAEMTTEEIDTYIDLARQEQNAYETSRVKRRGWHGYTHEQRRISVAQRAEREAVSRGRKVDHKKILERV